MGFQIGVTLVSTTGMVGNLRVDMALVINKGTMISEPDRPVLALNFLQ